MPNDARPLAGVKVVDFMWVIAGPSTTRVLADMGASVVRVEAKTSPDAARTAGVFINGEPGPENASGFQTFNAGKLGLTLNLSTEEGRSVVGDLAAWADILAESFTAGRMAKWGLGYEDLRAINPRLIMLSTCLFGQTGPLADFAGFGNMAHSITGFTNIGGYPGRPPVGPFLAYTDCVAPRFSVAAVMAALLQRERTDVGIYIDQAQAEGALHFLGPQILDYQVNGHVLERDSNHDPSMAPHGVYPTSEEDTWIAIAARSDNEWSTLARLVGGDALAADQRYATTADPKAQEESLDALLGGWTAEHEADALEVLLQAAGVAAYPVQGSARAWRDTQLLHRGHFAEVAHPTHGSTIVEGTRFSMSRTPPKTERGGPTFGQHNDFVLRDLLGYDDEWISELAIAGALE